MHTSNSNAVLQFQALWTVVRALLLTSRDLSVNAASFK